MIKKNKLSLLALAIVSILFFTACSQDVYSGFFNLMSGNVYSDTLGITLPGESADAAIEAVEEATEPTLKSVTVGLSSDDETKLDSGDTVSKSVNTNITEGELAVATTNLDAVVKKGSDIDSSYVNDILSASEKKIVVIYGENGETTVPKLLKKTEAEKQALTASLTTNNEQAKESLKNSLNVQETNTSTLLAAHNTSLIVKSGLSAINSNLVDEEGDATAVKEIKNQLRALADKLTPELPDSPTKADILQVQMAYNVANSLNDAFVAMKAQSDKENLKDVNFQEVAQNSGVMEKLISVLNDANAAITVANLNNQNGELIDTINIGSLIDSLTSKSSSKGLSLTDSEKAELNSRIKDLSPTIKMFLENYLGIKKSGGKYVYDSTLNKENRKSNLVISGMFNSYFSVDLMASYNNELKNKLKAYNKFVGLDGLETYFISFFLDNIDLSLENLLEYYNNQVDINSKYNDVEGLMNAYLEKHTVAFDAIFNNTAVDVMSFYYIDSDTTFVDPILVAIGGDEDNFELYNFITNMIGKDDLNLFIRNCKIVLNNTPSAEDGGILTDISDALESFQSDIADYYK